MGIAETLRTHKKLKFHNWPVSVLIINEMLQFPALLEHARRVIPSPDTHPYYKVIPILKHPLLHQVIPNAETDRHTIWENAETLVVFFFCWRMELTNAQT